MARADPDDALKRVSGLIRTASEQVASKFELNQCGLRRQRGRPQYRNLLPAFGVEAARRFNLRVCKPVHWIVGVEVQRLIHQLDRASVAACDERLKPEGERLEGGTGVAHRFNNLQRFRLPGLEFLSIGPLFVRKKDKRLRQVQ